MTQYPAAAPEPLVKGPTVAMSSSTVLLVIDTVTVGLAISVGYLVGVMAARYRIARELAAWHRWLTITRHDPLEARQQILTDLALRVESLTGTRLR